MPGVWQTFIFDSRFDPIVTMNGDGVLRTATNKGVFEQLAFSLSIPPGRSRCNIDDVEHLCSGARDFDWNGHVDMSDFDHFQACALGPAVGLVDPNCQDADLDADGDADCDDFAIFQSCYTGPDRRVDWNCR